MNKNNGFTLLELLLVILLLVITFGVIGFTFVNNLTGIKRLDITINQEVSKLSLINQLSKQLFARFEYHGKPNYTNIILERDHLSFYTLYPAFFQGCVRAEYTFEKIDENKVKVIYEEFPFRDGNLGMPGLKKQVVGIFPKLSLEVLKRDKWYENYKGTKVPTIFRLIIGDETYYITDRGKK